MKNLCFIVIEVKTKPNISFHRIMSVFEDGDEAVKYADYIRDAQLDKGVDYVIVSKDYHKKG